MKELKTLDWKELGIMAKTKTADIYDEGDNMKNRITVTFTNEDTTYAVDMSKSNARYLIQKLKAAIKLA